MSDITPTITTAEDWKKSSGSSPAGFPLLMPSGHTALVRRPGLQYFLSSGTIPNSLMSTMMETLSEADKAGQEGRPPQLDQKKLQSELMDDTQKLEDLFRMIDDVTVYCVIEPKVAPVPEEGGERDDKVLYVDEVDLDDKFFIFSYAVGGTANLERFRQEQAVAVAGVEAVVGVEGKA